MGDEFDVACEAVAAAFHETYEELAPHFSYETRPESRMAWESVPVNNRQLMAATVAVLAKEQPDLLRAVLDAS